MAGTATSRYQGINSDGWAYEVFDCALTNPTTSFTITPSKIKSIEFVSVTPTNAAAATAAKGYIASFVPGGGTVVVTSATATTYLVKVEGRIA